MSDFRVIVVSGHGYPAYRSDHEDFSTVAPEVARLVELMCDADGKFVDEYLFDHDDLILVFGPDGHVVQGEEDPFGLTAFAVLVDEAADVAREWADGAGLSMRPIFEGEIAAPEFVYELGAPNAAP